jgi:hypothetical protein
MLYYSHNNLHMIIKETAVNVNFKENAISKIIQSKGLLLLHGSAKQQQ